MMQRIAIIPAALVSALLLAAAGGFYVWREISVPPVMQKKNITVPLASVAPLPASASVIAPELLIPDDPISAIPSLLVNSPPDKAKRKSRPDNSPKLKTSAALAPPVRIEHSHESIAVDPILLNAWQAYRDGDLDTALQHYGEVLHKDAQHNNPPDRNALLGLAAIAQQRSQDAVAAQYYSRLLALDPRDPDAHAGMSSLLGATGTAGTESRLKLLLAQRPEAAALHFALGNYYAEQSRWGDAEQSYFTACKLESDNARFAFNLAVSLDHLGQEKLAAQHYQHALQLDPANNPGFDHAQTQLRLIELAR